MPPVVIVGAVVAAVLLWNRFRAIPGLPRVYTKADGPALRELKLLRAGGIGRALRLCLAKEKDKGKSTLDVYVGSLAGAAGLVVGAVTLNPQSGVKTMRAITDGYQSQRGKDAKDAPCAKEWAQAQSDMARHDELCAQLGFPPDVASEVVDAAWMSIGGDNWDAVTSQTVTTTTKGTRYVPSHSNTTTWVYTQVDLDTWDRGVRAHGLASMLAGWDNGPKPPPPYDPKSGLALRK